MTISDVVLPGGTAEQGIAEEEALKKGMEAKSKAFVERRREGLRKDVIRHPSHANCNSWLKS